MDKKAKEAKLNSILYGDDHDYGYLFPNQFDLPTIDKHIFADLRSINTGVDEHIVSNMMNTDYIGWTVKVLLNIQLYPFQMMILQTLWRTTFPMLIACRGGSKCVKGDTLCRTSDGLLQIDEIVDCKSPPMQRVEVDCLMAGENGYNKPSYGWNNGVSETKILELRSGIKIESTDNHPIRCIDNTGHIIWKNADEIVIGDFVPIVRKQYAFGQDKTTTQDLAWWLGLMIGDGMFTQRSHLNLSAKNESIVNEFFRITEKEFGYTPKPIARKDHYNIYSVGIWDKLNDLYGVGGKNSYTKQVPLLIRKSPRNVVAAFVRGLFDADGCVSQNCKTISYASCSEVLARQIQQILLGFGIISTLRKRYTKSQNGTEVESYQVTIYGEFNICLYGRHIGFVCDYKKDILHNRQIKKINHNKDFVRNIQSIVLQLREKFVIHTGGPNKKGQGLKNTLVEPPCRILEYEMCHEKLDKFLKSIACMSDDEDWKYLRHICDQHYYFDEIVDIKNSQCQTFDVNIPDDHSFISNGFISHNSYTLAIYAVLRALLDPGCKIVIVGFGLRQAKLVFGYIETMWHNSPLFQNICRDNCVNKNKLGPRQNVDLCVFQIGDSTIHALPLGDGSRIRGFRANVVIADEFAVIPPDTFDIVVRGFAATAKTPIEDEKRAVMQKKLEQLGMPTKFANEMSNQKVRGNQIVYSGTAYYAFNHFAKKFQTWKDIINSNNDRKELARIFGGVTNIPEDFDTKDYAIIRVPHTHMPDRLLDKKMLANAKAVLPKNIFLMEYGAVFVRDSDGFFPRSLLEQCICYPDKTINTPDGDVCFSPQMRGEERCKYVIGIDPAAERDNFAIVIVEVRPNHSRIIYCWVVNKKSFELRRKNGWVDHDNYYEYCCSKIRYLAKLFKPERIEMDSQGGGTAVAEMLRNKKLVNVDVGEQPIYEIIDMDEPKHTDGETDGPQILHLVKQSSEFNAQANVCLHKSFETKKLLFPAFNVVQMEASRAAEASNKIQHDTFEENINNIEELKNELCTIRMSETSTGKEKFDTPNVTQPGSVEGRQIKGRLRKDRYTALLLAHKYIYENEVKTESSIDYNDVVGNIRALKKVRPTDKMYRGMGIDVIPGRGPSHRAYRGTQGGTSF